MMQNAILIVLVYWLIRVAESTFLSWQCLTRPIVVAPITGLVLGDFYTGIIMGASLEAIFMGISAIGGSIPADPTISSIIAVSFTILSDTDIESGLALAMPIGTLMSSFNSMFTPFWASLAPYWEKLATSDIKKFTRQVLLVSVFGLPLVNCIVLFVAIAYGVDSLNSLLTALPVWVITGLGAASRMMIAVGFAILASMIYSGELGCFFFVGYVLVKYLEMDILSIAIIAGAIAITMFYSEKRFITIKTTSQTVGNESTLVDEEEDFF